MRADDAAPVRWSHMAVGRRHGRGHGHDDGIHGHGCFPVKSYTPDFRDLKAFPFAGTKSKLMAAASMGLIDNPMMVTPYPGGPPKDNVP